MRKTAYLFVEGTGGLLAIDAGWPGWLHEYMKAMKQGGLRFQDIRWAMVTHFHIDHAGLVSEFLEHGIECFVFDHQLAAIDAMEKTIAAHAREYGGYRPIDRSKLTVVSVERSREILTARGIDGECFATPGHSDDSLSVQCNEDVAIGDLSLPEQTAENDVVTRASWAEIRRRGGRRIYPSHAPEFEL